MVEDEFILKRWPDALVKIISFLSLQIAAGASHFNYGRTNSCK